MTDQVFQLDNYRGPLDLLLHLVREQEVDILEVDLSRLCDQYLAAVQLMQQVDIDVAGEFLVMASTLILIKSRRILPREEEVDLEEELDPADELIQQLLEYRKYKSLSLELGRRAEERAQRVARGASEVPPDEENELAELGLWDLVGAFVRLMEEVGLHREFHTLKAEKPLRVYMEQTLDVLVSRERASLAELLEAAGGPSQLFGVFLSILELVKSQQVAVRQEGADERIVVELRQDRDASLLSFLYVDGPPRPEAGADGGDAGPAPQSQETAQGSGGEEPGGGQDDEGLSPSPAPAPSVRAVDGAPRLAGPEGAGMVSHPPLPARQDEAGS